MTGLLALVFVLALFPASHVVVARLSRGRARQAYFAAWALGIALLVAAARVPSAALAATFGLLAGLALWSANGELGEAAGIGVPIGPGNWPLLLLVFLFLALWSPATYPWLAELQARLGVAQATPAVTAGIGVQVAFEFLLLTWLGHVTLLTAYYDPRFGPRSPLTYALFALSLALTALLLPVQFSRVNWNDAVRWAVPTVIASWSVIEILMKWGVVPKPWGK